MFAKAKRFVMPCMSIEYVATQRAPRVVMHGALEKEYVSRTPAGPAGLTLINSRTAAKRSSASCPHRPAAKLSASRYFELFVLLHNQERLGVAADINGFPALMCKVLPSDSQARHSKPPLACKVLPSDSQVRLPKNTPRSRVEPISRRSVCIGEMDSSCAGVPPALPCADSKPTPLRLRIGNLLHGCSAFVA